MPRGDGTGPTGMGSRTGRGAGYCAGNTMPGYANRPLGFGQGGGRGAGQGCGLGISAGRGWRNMFRLTGLPGWMRLGQGGAPAAQASAAPQPDLDERLILKQQAEVLNDQLDKVKQRLSELGD